MGSWTQTDLLLAEVADRVAVLSWQWAGDSSTPMPTPIPRPGVEHEPDGDLVAGTEMTLAEADAWLAMHVQVEPGQDQVREGGDGS